MDVPGCPALLKEAKAAQDSGDLKTAYYEYTKALNLLTRALGTRIRFKGPDTLEASPEGFSFLVQQAQEILIRLESIVLQTKKMPSVSSSASLSTLSSKPTSRPPLRSRPSSSPSVRSGSFLLRRDKTKRNIPLIPISPLTKLALEHNYNLAQVSQRLEQAKQEGARSPSSSLSGGRDLAQLRRLIEDVRIQRAKVDAVSAQIQSVAHKSLVDWDADVLARQLTIIDTVLFKKVTIPKDLVRHDRRYWPAQACIELETYVAHSLAHVILQAWDVSRHPQLHTTSSASSNSGSPVHSKSSNATPAPNVITHLIRVAHILLHVYRNFNSFMAIMRTLTSPETKRASSLWSGVPSKTKDLFRKLVTLADEHNHAQQYRETLRAKLEAFQDVGRDALVAIPWMRYHQEEVKSILHSYMTGHETRDGSMDVVLSAPGARKLSAVTALLTQCRSNEANQDDLLHPLAGLDHKASKNSTNSSTNNTKDAQQSSAKNREPVSVDGLRHALAPIVDLASLGTGDATVHHWLLTRPYLDKQQLIDESLEIEPLANGEELPCVDRPLEENDDQSSTNGDDDHSDDGGHANESFEHVAVSDMTSESLTPLAPNKPSIRDPESDVSDEELDAIMDELLGGDELDDGDGLFSDDDLGTTKRGQQEQPSTELPTMSKHRSELSSDVLDFLGLDPSELRQSSSDDEDGGFGTLARTTPKDKGKARAQSQEEADNSLFERFNNLTQKSSVLIQESRVFQREVEDDTLKGQSQADLHEDDLLSSATSSPWPVKKFEPMTQGTEQDELRIDDTGVQGKEMKDMTGEQVILSPALSGHDSPQVEEAAFSSLDALRRQLDQMHKTSEAPMARLESRDTTQEETTTDNNSALDGELGRNSTPPEAPSDSASNASFPSHFVSSSNPFAQYVKPTIGDAPARTEPVRTLRTKRSKVVLKPGESTESRTEHAASAATGTNLAISSNSLCPPSTEEQPLPTSKEDKPFSPPRLFDSIANPLLASEDERMAIQERARQSLASHSHLAKAATLTSDVEENLTVPVTLTPPTLQYNGMTDSVPPKEPKDIEDKESVIPSGREEGDDHQSGGNSTTSSSPPPQDASSPLSPSTSPDGARSPSRGRQRRRIAGGMVSLPTPSKALTSLSTLSNAGQNTDESTTIIPTGSVAEAEMLGEHLVPRGSEPPRDGLETRQENESSQIEAGDGATATGADDQENDSSNKKVVNELAQTSLEAGAPLVEQSPPSLVVQDNVAQEGGGDGGKDGLLIGGLEGPSEEDLTLLDRKASRGTAASSTGEEEEEEKKEGSEDSEGGSRRP